MTLYSRMLDGDHVDWKWCFCQSCKMEWLVPAGDPDAYPKYCCHCCEPIDMNVTPSDVLDDVEPANDPPERYDVNLDASQYSTFECGPGATMRVCAIQEYHDLNDVEHLIISQELTLLVNPWVAVSVRMSHYSLQQLAFFLDDYVSTCGDILGRGEKIVNHETLKRFNGFTDIDER